MESVDLMRPALPRGELTLQNPVQLVGFKRGRKIVGGAGFEGVQPSRDVGPLADNYNRHSALCFFDGPQHPAECLRIGAAKHNVSMANTLVIATKTIQRREHALQLRCETIFEFTDDNIGWL